MKPGTIAACALLAGVLAAPDAAAVGLGGIEVQSGLNQPFRARIALTGLTPGEAADLRVALAGDEAFERADLERSWLLTRLRFAVSSSGERAGQVHVTSQEAIREPALSFIVEVASGGKAVQRRYDVLLNLR